MAAANAELIRPIYDEWSRGNWRPRFDVYDPQMEWGWSDEFPGLAGVYEDRRDPNPRLRAWLSPWEHWWVEPDEWLEIGDYVVVLATYHGRGKGSGVEVSQQGAHVFRLRHHKVVRLEIFTDRQRAIDSVRNAVPEERTAVGSAQRPDAGISRS
jgi:ketosteroid isomerase-like protein